MSTHFWDRVEDLLINNNLTRKELALYAGFDVSNIGKGKKENSIPAADTAQKIAEFLHTSVEYLVTGKDIVHFGDIGDELYDFYRYRFTVKQLDSLPEEARNSIVITIKEVAATYEKLKKKYQLEKEE